MDTTQETEFDYQTHMNESARGPGKINRGTKAREKRREAVKVRVSQNSQLSRVLEKIQEIAETSADGDYIYRGEPKHYKKVSSSLYRKYRDIDAEHFDIEIVQNEILEEAKKFTREIEDSEILTELQHYGGATNLIDFTTDCLIALFFACDGSDFLEKDGRVILLQKTKQVNEWIKFPQNPRNRIIAQKSVFVRPPNGFIEPDYVINIPKDLKFSMLNYLRKQHGISMETIYNDLHGFIRYQNVHQSAYAEFYAGLTCQNEKDHPKTIEHYSRAIELNPRLVEAYNNRGNAYIDIGEVDRAIVDYNKAIELNPDFALAYVNRGNYYRNKGEVDRAIVDYDKAIELNPKLSEAYNARGASYIDRGEVDRAIIEYNKAIGLKPDDADVYSNRGNAYLRKGAYDFAVEDLNKAIELKPDFAEVYDTRGTIYGFTGKFDYAIKDFTKAIELNPEFAEAYYNRGMCWLHLKNWQEARPDLIAAKSMGMDIIAVFRNTYRNGEDFEQRNRVKLPEDIAAMLMP